MGRTASSVGMMEGAFFVSRTELIQWVNNLLGLNLTKVEQCASGAVYCQILDSCHPGGVKMAKVNWMAKAEHEFIPNYKILQAAFDRARIEKHIDVDKLIRAKYQDNLEFLQWMKCYWEREGAAQRDYDAVRARDGRPIPAWAKPIGMPSAAPMPRAAALDISLEKENVASNREVIVPQKAKVATSSRPTTPSAGNGAKTPRSMLQANTHEHEELRAKVAEQAQEIDDMKQTLDGLEQERDYYFRKLRNVEILCETLQAKMGDDVNAESIIKQVQGILYAENEEDEELPTEGDSAPIQGQSEDGVVY